VVRDPPGRYLLAWERAEFDRAVADIFGYHALQMGLPELDALQANRMPHKWLALSEAGSVAGPRRPDVVTDFGALPFEENSLDLVVLPHSLELNIDPHTTLREVERVLVPEGKVVICCLNPASLWGLRQRRAHLYRRLGFGELYLPDAGDFIGYWRLRDWLRLLSFEVETSSFGLLAPGLLEREVAGTLRLDGSGGRTVLADLRRRLFHRGRQARARRHPDRPRVEASPAARGRADAGRQPEPARNARVDSHRMNQVEIYTDGACKGNPGPGGWGVLLRSGATRKELYGGEPGTTNNRMELMAVIRALEALKRPCAVTLYLDSQYVLKGITEWLPGWKAKGWKTASRQPVKNAELWRRLDELVAGGGHVIDWRWVRGHNGDPGNERADALANMGVESVQRGSQRAV